MQKKVFIGFPLTLPLKSELQKVDLNELTKIPNQGKEYIGKYLEMKSPTISEIKAFAREVTALLQAKIESHLFEPGQMVIFSETFFG